MRCAVHRPVCKQILHLAGRATPLRLIIRPHESGAMARTTGAIPCREAGELGRPQNLGRGAVSPVTTPGSETGANLRPSIRRVSNGVFSGPAGETPLCFSDSALPNRQ